MKVHIIGGGIIGLCSAWYLQQEGFEVTVIDSGSLTDGTSHGNAGMIVPSHFTPLAAPGVITQGLRWLTDAKSPFFIRPRLSWELAQWLWQFYRASSARQARAAMPVLRDYNQLSRALYQEFAEMEGFDFCFGEKGLLMLYRDAKSEQEEIEGAEQAHELGIRAEVLDSEAVQALENGIRLDVRGGVWYPGDAHLYPNHFMAQLKSQLMEKGAKFLLNCEVQGFVTSSSKVEQVLLANGRKENVEQLVVAAGSWSAQVLSHLGVRLLLEDGKGYSFTLANAPLRPAIPTILTEAKVAVTPMGNDLRIGGTLEISHFSQRVNRARLAGIVESMPRYYPDLSFDFPEVDTVWQGYRPCSPDGMPYMGYSQRYNNLLIATGHAMMGLSLGPASGKLVAELLTDQPSSVDLDLMIPERFHR